MGQSTSISDGREVLVNFGNRYVLFDRPGRLPTPHHFIPERDSELLDRVGHEHEGAEERVVKTLRVQGLRRAEAPNSDIGDITFIDENGRRVLIEVKVRDRPARQADLQFGWEAARRAQERGEELETWFFNLERLDLTILRDLHAVNDRLVPVDVWEKTEDGIFSRERVTQGVAAWADRVTELYDRVEETLRSEPDLSFDRARTVVMSEELMQRFAVPDRELPILDVIRNGEAIASFVPRGRWVLGSCGRIDLITPATTTILALIEVGGVTDWRWVEQNDRRKTHPFDRSALRSLVIDHE